MPERRYGAGQGHPTGWTLDQLKGGWSGMDRGHVASCCFRDFVDEIERLREIEKFLREDLPDSKRWVERAETLLSIGATPGEVDG